MNRPNIYVCPECGNVVVSSGSAFAAECCGLRLEPLTAKEPDDAHALAVERVEQDFFLTCAHPMEKEHYISCVIAVASGSYTVCRTFPEWELQMRVPQRGLRELYYCCTRDGLFRVLRTKL